MGGNQGPSRAIPASGDQLRVADAQIQGEHTQHNPAAIYGARISEVELHSNPQA